MNLAEATTCTVILNNAAPIGGTEVLLSSDNALLPVPVSSVIVPTGANSVTFMSTAGSTASPQQATLTAIALNSVLLSWTASESPNLMSYEVYRGVTPGGPYALLATLGLVTSYIDYNVQASQTYYYVSTAVDDTGAESADSNAASAVVPNQSPQSAIVTLSGLNQVTFTSDSPSVWIDVPAANAVLSGTTTIGGWAIESTAAAGPNAISQVAVFVDGVQVGLATYGAARPDVCDLWPGRPGCPDVGWSYSLNTAALAAGSHTLQIVATDTAGITGSSQVNFTSDSPSVWIDVPAANAVLSGTTTIGGWAIESTAAAGPNAIGQVAVFVDGVQVGLATYGAARPDVCDLWPGRPGCPDVGWSYSLNTAALAAGSHTLRIVATDTAGITGSSQVKFD